MMKNRLKFLKGGEFKQNSWHTKMSFKKERIDFNPFNKKYYKNFFVESISYESKTITCNCCCKIGNISNHYPLKRGCPNCIQIWVPKGPKPLNVN